MKKSIWVGSILVVILAVGITYEVVKFSNIKDKCIESLGETFREISIYLSSSTTDQKAELFTEKIRVIEGVENTTYTSSVQQLEMFKQRYSNDPNLSQSLKELAMNPLFPSISIKFKTATQASNPDKDILFQDAARASGVKIEHITGAESQSVLKMLNKISPFVGITSLWSDEAAFAKNTLQECVDAPQK